MSSTPLNQYEKHKRILKEYIFEKFSAVQYKNGIVSRPVAKTNYEEVNDWIWTNESVSTTGRIIYPEFIEYCYFLEGCSKKLLFFLIFHYAGSDSCAFLYNAQTVEDFHKYDSIMVNDHVSYKRYSQNTIKKALAELVTMNIVTNIEHKKYMFNPMIIGVTKNTERKRELFSKYCRTLMKKGKNCVNDFLPK